MNRILYKITRNEVMPVLKYRYHKKESGYIFTKILLIGNAT